MNSKDSITKKRKPYQKIVVFLLILLLTAPLIVIANISKTKENPQLLGNSSNFSTDVENSREPSLGASHQETPDKDSAILGDSMPPIMSLQQPFSNGITDNYRVYTGIKSPGYNDLIVTAQAHLGQSPKTVIIPHLNSSEAIWVVNATKIEVSASYTIDTGGRNTVSMRKLKDDYSGWKAVRNLSFSQSGNKVYIDLETAAPELIKDPGIYSVQTLLWKKPIRGGVSEGVIADIIINPEYIEPIITLVDATGRNNNEDPSAVLFDFKRFLLPEDLDRPDETANTNEITQSWTLTGNGINTTGVTQSEFDGVFYNLTPGTYNITLYGEVDSIYGHRIRNSQTKTFILTKPPTPEIPEKDQLKGVLTASGGFERNNIYYNPQSLDSSYTLKKEFFSNPVYSSLTLQNLGTGETTSLFQNQILPEQGRSYSTQNQPNIFKNGTYQAILEVETTDNWNRVYTDTVTTEFTIKDVEPTVEIDRTLNPSLGTLTPVFSDSASSSYQWSIFKGSTLVQSGSGLTVDASVFGNLPASTEEKTAYTLEFSETIAPNNVVTTSRKAFSVKKPKPTFVFEGGQLNPEKLVATRDSELAALSQGYAITWKVTSQTDDVTIASGSGDTIEKSQFPTTPGLYQVKITESFAPYHKQNNEFGTVTAPFEVKALYGSVSMTLRSNEGWSPHGDAVVSLRLEHSQSGKVFYQTISLPPDTYLIDHIPTSTSTKTVQLEHLPVGVYQVSILSSHRYTLISQSSPTVEVFGNQNSSWDALLEQKNYQYLSDAQEGHFTFHMSE